MIKIKLSRKLGELRWSQADLSRATGIGKNIISSYYNEMTDRVNIEHLDKICEVLDCDLSEILEYEKNTIPTVTHNRNGTEKVFR